MWAWPAQRHLAAHNIHELRQLIDAGSTQQSADVRDARIVAGGLRNGITVFLNRHCSELEHHERLAIKAFAVLAEDDRSRPVEPNGNRGEPQERSEKH